MKKSLAILLSAVLLFTALPLAVFGAGTGCDCGKAPRICLFFEYTAFTRRMQELK